MSPVALRAIAVILTAGSGLLVALAEGGKLFDVLGQLNWVEVTAAVTTLVGIGSQILPQLGAKKAAEAKVRKELSQSPPPSVAGPSLFPPAA
jgi:hypothetical protein